MRRNIVLDILYLLENSKSFLSFFLKTTQYKQPPSLRIFYSHLLFRLRTLYRSLRYIRRFLSTAILNLLPTHFLPSLYYASFRFTLSKLTSEVSLIHESQYIQHVSQETLKKSLDISLNVEPYSKEISPRTNYFRPKIIPLSNKLILRLIITFFLFNSQLNTREDST